MDEKKTITNKQIVKNEEYRVKRNYGTEDIEECLLRIVRFKISQILHKKENIVT